jgi:RimJ/RimL family protein N-acetyltransferase
VPLLPDALAAGPVQLLRWHADQLDDLMGAISLSFPELQRWMPWAESMPTAVDELAVLHSGSAAFDADHEWQYLIHETRSGALVGGAGLRRRMTRPVLELGYWIRTDRTGLGYATAAARALANAAFSHVPGIDTVEIHTDAANLASAAIPPKLGFSLVRQEPRSPQTRGGTGTFLVWELERAHAPVRVSAGIPSMDRSVR